MENFRGSVITPKHISMSSSPFSRNSHSSPQIHKGIWDRSGETLPDRNQKLLGAPKTLQHCLVEQLDGNKASAPHCEEEQWDVSFRRKNSTNSAIYVIKLYVKNNTIISYAAIDLNTPSWSLHHLVRFPFARVHRSSLFQPEGLHPEITWI